MPTVEYAALALLVSTVVAAGGATVDAERVPAAVGDQLRRALCLVASGDCLSRAGPRPCVVRALQRDRDARVSVAMARLRDGRTVLREQRSDGTVRVTVVQATGAGMALHFGAGVTVGGQGVRAGVEAGGGADAAYGRAFIARDAAAADRLIARLARDDARVGGALPGVVRFAAGRDGGDEDERFVEFGAAAQADAVLEALGLGASARALREVTAGVRIDRRTGEHTLALRLDRAVEGALAAPLAQLGGGRAAATAVELALGRDRRPATLMLRRVDAIRGDAQLGPFTSGGGDRAEIEARLDLADDRARALLDASLRGDARAAGSLARHLADHARVDTRLYATTHAESTKGASVSLLTRLGAEIVRSTDTARLVAAAGREPGLGWARRFDCVLAA
jgi:hypothetical protein